MDVVILVRLCLSLLHAPVPTIEKPRLPDSGHPTLPLPPPALPPSSLRIQQAHPRKLLELWNNNVSMPSSLSWLPAHRVASLEIIKVAATVLEIKEWSEMLMWLIARCLMIGLPILYDHPACRLCALKHDYRAYRYFLRYSIGYHVILDV